MAPVQRNELFSFYMIYQQEAIIWLRLYSYKTHLLAFDCVFFCLWDPDTYYPWIQIQLLPLKQMAGPKIWNSLPKNVRNVKNRGNKHFRRSTKQFSFCKSALWAKKTTVEYQAPPIWSHTESNFFCRMWMWMFFWKWVLIFVKRLPSARNGQLI